MKPCQPSPSIVGEQKKGNRLLTCEEFEDSVNQTIRKIAAQENVKEADLKKYIYAWLGLKMKKPRQAKAKHALRNTKPIEKHHGKV